MGLFNNSMDKSNILKDRILNEYFDNDISTEKLYSLIKDFFEKHKYFQNIDYDYIIYKVTNVFLAKSEELPVVEYIEFDTFIQFDGNNIRDKYISNSKEDVISFLKDNKCISLQNYKSKLNTIKDSMLSFVKEINYII